MILGDARMGMSYQMEHSYSSSVLKSDIVQMAHHGFTGVQDDLYKMIDADVVLWPMDVVGNKDDETLFKNYLNNAGELDIAANDYVRTNAQEIIPAHENVCLTLPYTAKTYSGGKQTVDLDKAYTDKLFKLATAQSGADTSWYDADKSVYYIYDANDLLGFANLAAGGNNFSGKTIMLMADIDLNPGWNADVTIGDKVVFPTAPATAWPNIATFKGTFDGNGYTVSGIYSAETITEQTGTNGGLFDILDGGTVKNLKISNSFMYTVHTGENGSHGINVGGIAGQVNAGSTLYNVYMDNTTEVWYQSDKRCVLGGAFGAAAGAYNATGFVFHGTLGYTSSDLKANFAPSSTEYPIIGLVIANQGSYGGTIRNCHTLKTSIHIGGELKNYCKSSDRIGTATNIDSWNYYKQGLLVSCVANTVETEAWLETRGWDYGYYFTWNGDVQGSNEPNKGSIIPKEAAALVAGTYDHAVPEIMSTLSTDENVICVYTSSQLLSALKSGGNFAGKTIKLMADIDLNPGWSAEAVKKTNSSSANIWVFPSVPNNVWPNIDEFKGTLDGNGYTLKGIYSYKSGNYTPGVYGGLFNKLNGGTVKNIRIENSFILIENYGTAAASGKSVHIGGIAGDLYSGSTISNVFTDWEVWFKSESACMLGGAFGFVQKDSSYATITGLVSVGRIGNTNKDFATNFSCSGNIYVARMVATQNFANEQGQQKCIVLDEIVCANNKASDTRWGVDRSYTGASMIANSAEGQDFLDKNQGADKYGGNFTVSTKLGHIIPNMTISLIDGGYEHEKEQFVTPEILYQVSDVENGTYDIRFVSGIDNIQDPTAVGFNFVLHVNGQSYTHEARMTTVYSSILADGKTVAANEVNEDYEYLFAYAINGVTATDNVVIDVSVVYVCEGQTVVGSTITYAFCCGTAQVR